MKRRPHVTVVAGEASGDIHGARLARELRGMFPDMRLTGIGGPALEKQGAELLYRAEDLAVMGFSEVLPKLGFIFKVLRGMRRHLAAERPDLVILIDYPDFNFLLGPKAKKLGLKVLYYVCPQVWAWRLGRARKMARFVDKLAATYPFEPRFLADIAPELNTVFVGHPLLDHEGGEPAEYGALPVPGGKTLVGLLPGSRETELRNIMPTLLRAAAIMAAKRDDLHFVLPLAPGLSQAQLDPYLAHAPPGFTVVSGRTQQVMESARVLLVTSGTATLQAALAGTPMVVVYKTGGLNYLLASRMIKVDFIAMPNLIAGRRVAPELIQGGATPETVAEEGLKLLGEGGERAEMIAGLQEVKQAMGGPGASRRVAGLARDLITEQNEPN